MGYGTFSSNFEKSFKVKQLLKASGTLLFVKYKPMSCCRAYIHQIIIGLRLYLYTVVVIDRLPSHLDPD